MQPRIRIKSELPVGKLTIPDQSTWTNFNDQLPLGLLVAFLNAMIFSLFLFHFTVQIYQIYPFIISTSLLSLLHPLWNHWLSVQSDWLSAVWFIPKSHHFLLLIASVPNRVIYVLNRIISVLNSTIFVLYRIISVWNTKWDVKAFLFRLFNKPATWSTKY